MILYEVIDGYFDKYENCKITELSGGNINTTFLLEIYYNNRKDNYLLQMINKNVFCDPVAVIKNSNLILDYINEDTLYYIKTKKNTNYFLDSNKNYWRIYNYIDNSFSLSSTNNLYIIYQAGKAFGSFHKKLINFDYIKLNETIPNFHNTSKYVEKFKILSKDKSSRFKRIQREYDKILNYENKCTLLDRSYFSGLLPLRTTHNDTKINNVLFNKRNNRYITVIDFDTVMPGLFAHDFGDGARSVCSVHEEDHLDYYTASFSIEKFKAYAQGFLSQTKNILTEYEKETLYDGILALTLELSIRFLIDYLEDDIYFKTKYLEHNYVRGLNQLYLAEDIIKKEKTIKEIIYKNIK